MAVEIPALRGALGALVAKMDRLGARRSRMLEEQTKKDFILPMFRALGWNIEDSDEVAAEETASAGRVDYAFRIAGVPFLLLEAKPLKSELGVGAWAAKALNYAYHKGVAWIVLTNFDELVVLNAEVQEVDARRAIFLTFKASEYVERVEQIALLSKASLATGALDKAADQWGKRPKRRPVGLQLLEDLMDWRDEFTKYYRSYNSQLPATLLAEGVQKQLDRFVFIRTAEDRLLEERRLWEVLQRYKLRKINSLQEAVAELVREYDKAYDSRLFEPHAVDAWSTDDAPFVKTIQGLYGPSSGYVTYSFDSIGADVLGGIYEQYLEALKSSGSSKRREQGIYYTPRWVVRFITRYTIDQTLRRMPADGRDKIQVLDLACGSGSFLVAALDALHDALEPGSHSTTRPTLTGLRRRLELLTRNIHGLDLDQQAVEIAQLNLLLSVLSLRSQLPDLQTNVEHGNALIEGGQAELEHRFGPAWRELVPKTFEQQFDVVIGNPPYVKIQRLPKDQRDYFREKYPEITGGSYDVFSLFVKRAIDLLSPDGFLGFIVPVRLLQADYGLALMQHLATRATLHAVVDLREIDVFADAATYPVIAIFQKGQRDAPVQYYKVPTPPSSTTGLVAEDYLLSGLSTFPHIEASQVAATRGYWPPTPLRPPVNPTRLERDAMLPDALSTQGVPLKNWREDLRIYQGLITGRDEVFVVERKSVGAKTSIVHSEADGRDHEIENELLRSLIKSEDVIGSAIRPTARKIVMPYQIRGGRAEVMDPTEFARDYPKAWAYFSLFERELRDREKKKFDNDRWYQFSRTQNIALNLLPKLVVPYVVEHLRCAFDSSGEYCIDNIGVGGIHLGSSADASEYLLLSALFTSEPIDTVFRLRSVRFGGGFYSANRQFLEDLPVPRLGKANRATSDRVTAIARAILREDEILAALPDGHSSGRSEARQRRRGLERELVELIYDLYELPRGLRLDDTHERIGAEQ